MEENIIVLIAEAEQKAAAKKAQAQAAAADIVSAAEIKAQQIAKSSEEECAQLRENTVKNAELAAASNYEKAIEKSRAAANEYANSHLEQAEGFVLDIIGRLTK